MARSGNRRRQQRKRRQSKRHTQPQPLQPKKARWQNAGDWLKTTLYRSWALFAASALLFGVATGLLALYPRISVSPSTAIDSKNPFSVPFTVSNDNPFPIYNVKLTCRIAKAGTNTDLQFSNVNFSAAPVSQIDPFEKTTAFCALPLSPIHDVQTADIDVIIAYDWPLISVRRQRPFPFVVVRNHDGQYQWLPRAAAEVRRSIAPTE